MKFLIASLALAVSAAAGATTLTCKQDRDGGKSRATLEIEKDRLVSAKVTQSGIKGHSTVEFTRKNSKFSVGSNSEQKFQHVSHDLNVKFPDAEVSLSYQIEEKGRKLSVEESLVGPQYAQNGTPYGKLRFDFTVPGGFDDIGWTYFYYCEIKK